MKLSLTLLATAACAVLLASPLAAANTDKAPSHAGVPNAWSPETLSGKIWMVDSAHNLVVVKGPDGVPFDMDVTRRTRIESGDRSVSLKDLEQDKNQQISIHFVPERRGDVAQTIKIG